jgi:hypothetical protein
MVPASTARIGTTASRNDRLASTSAREGSPLGSPATEAPSAQQRKSSMNPRQHNVRGHLADDARIMPVACQTRIGFVAIGEQRGSTLHVGSCRARS